MAGKRALPNIKQIEPTKSCIFVVYLAKRQEVPTISSYTKHTVRLLFFIYTAVF